MVREQRLSIAMQQELEEVLVTSSVTVHRQCFITVGFHCKYWCNRYMIGFDFFGRSLPPLIPSEPIRHFFLLAFWHDQMQRNLMNSLVDLVTRNQNYLSWNIQHRMSLQELYEYTSLLPTAFEVEDEIQLYVTNSKCRWLSRLNEAMTDSNCSSHHSLCIIQYVRFRWAITTTSVVCQREDMFHFIECQINRLIHTTASTSTTWLFTG